jgi:hypothetical protein
MPFATFAYGPYTATYNDLPIGEFEGSLEHFQIGHAREYRSSRFGDSPVGGIYTGMSVFFMGRLKEWTAATRAAMWPFDSLLGDSGVIGRAMEDMALALVLTAVAGTPAATTLGPATRTYSKAILMPEHSQQIVLGTEQRDVPIVMRCYPVIQDSVELRCFVDT